MTTIAIILIIITIFLIINSGPMPNPNRWICNILLGLATLLWLYGSYGLPR